MSIRSSHRLFFQPQVTTLWWIYQSFKDGKTILDSSGKFSVLGEQINSFLPGVSCELNFLIAFPSLSRVRIYGVYQPKPPSLFSHRYLDYVGLFKVSRLVRQKLMLWEGPSEKLRALGKFINLFHTMSEEGS